MPDLFRGRKWDLVGSRRLWFSISIVLLSVGMYFWATKGLKLGIDFTGGGMLTYQLPHSVASAEQNTTLSQVRGVVSGLDIDNEIQLAGPAFGGKNLVLVRTKVDPKGTDQQRYRQVQQQAKDILAGLTREFPQIKLVGNEVVGAVMSRELLGRALSAVGLGSLLVMLWIMIRYDLFFGQISPKWAFSAIVALLHDILMLIGIFALLQREVNSPFVAAILTVVGYSVHDTIIIFDRIRENLKLRKGHTFAETTNISLLETMARSVNTVLTVELTLLALFLFGGPTLRDFSLALIIGVTTGAYSSIFNASQILVVFKNREAHARAASHAGPRPARLAQPEPAAVGADSGRVAAAQPSAPGPAARKVAKGAGAKKRRKRY